MATQQSLRTRAEMMLEHKHGESVNWDEAVHAYNEAYPHDAFSSDELDDAGDDKDSSKGGDE